MERAGIQVILPVHRGLSNCCCTVSEQPSKHSVMWVQTECSLPCAEIQEGTGGGASSDRSPERGCSSNNALPFGLENCICDGNEKGNTAGQQICSNLKAQCLTIAPFSATRSDPLVRDVQQICDNFAYEECKQAARMTVVADSTCVDILFGTAQSTRCSADSARQIWEDMTEELCKPLCPECQRL